MEEKELIGWENLEGWICTVPNLAEEFIENHAEDVYLYGGGRASFFYLKYLASKGIPVRGIIETNPAQSPLGGGSCTRQYTALMNSAVRKEIAA